MKTSKIYLYLSIASLLLTFLTGLGFVLSIVMLFLIPSEKKNLLYNVPPNELQQELDDLKTAKTISIINLILNLLIVITVVVFFIFFGYFLINESPNLNLIR